MAAKKGKKDKAQPKKMSLKDRLARHWEAANWEAFVSLYLRDRAASEATLWVGRYVDGLYNCLTRAFFIHRAPETGREMALLLLETYDPNEDPDYNFNLDQDNIARDCARVALDFLAMRQDGAAVPTPLAAEDDLPEPWRALRAGLADSADGPRKRGRKKAAELPASPAGALLQKLDTQFTALPRAANLRVFTSFLQTAEALEKEVAGQPGAEHFQAVRAMAELLRELGGPKRGGDSLRDLSGLQNNQWVARIPVGADRPAVLSLWNFFCEQGGLKFGRDWEAAARVLRLRFDRSRPALAAAFQRYAEPGPYAPLSLLLHILIKQGGPWSEPELYLLWTTWCAAVKKGGPGGLEDMGGTILPDCFRALTSLGRKWRPARPWPVPVTHFFELIIRSLGNGLRRIVQLDLPYEHLTAPTLALLALMSPELTATITEAAAARLPLALSDDDLQTLGFDLSRLDPFPQRSALADLSKIFKPESFAGLLGAWVKSTVEFSAMKTADGQGQTTLPWDRLAADLLGFLADSLPAEGAAGLFCRLCLGRGQRTMSSETRPLAAFIDALAREEEAATKPGQRLGLFEDQEPDSDGFAANLFIMLTAWPEADPDFMAELFKLGQTFMFDQQDIWPRALESVNQIRDAKRRRALAESLFAVMEDAVDPERREARRCFDNLRKGRKVKVNTERFRNPFMELFRQGMEKYGDGFEDEIMRRFERMMGGGRRKKS